VVSHEILIDSVNHGALCS